MLIASRRGQWVLAASLLGLGATAATALLLVWRWQWAFMTGVDTLLTLLFLTFTMHRTRWVKRRGDIVSTWEPELWAPWRRRRLRADHLTTALRPEGRGIELILRAKSTPPVFLNSYVIGYDHKPKMQYDGQRVAAVLALPEP